MKQINAMLVLTVVLLSGCTDAKMGKFTSLGGSAEVKCYSGDLLIYEGISTGKIANSEQSDGFYFIDKASGEMIEVSGNCVINYGS